MRTVRRPVRRPGKRALVLGAAAAALSVTAALLSPPVWAADPPGSPVTLRLSGAASYRGIITTLDKDLYTPSFTSVFDAAHQADDLNRTMTTCSPRALKPVSVPIRDAWCWQPDDAATHDWIPQGVTGVSDAADDETWGGRPQKPIIVTWYSRTDGKGVRISIIDPATRRYRHALLVEPWRNGAGNASYRPVGVHAGGIAWYGRYLYVPDTRNGVRVFDLQHVFDLDPLGPGHRTRTPATDTDTTAKARVGRHGGVYYGYGYRYLIPQTARWTQPAQAPTGSCVARDDGAGMRFSSLTVNRSGADTLVAGEYCDGGSSRPGRMAAWPLSAVHARTVAGSDGSRVAPSTVWRLPSTQVQGVAHTGSAWYFTVSHGCSASALLVRTRTSTGWAGATSRAVGVGSEDLYVWRSAALVFSLTENAEVHWTCAGGQPGRVLYSTPA